jgi:SAM-dependent methyltransferase
VSEIHVTEPTPYDDGTLYDRIFESLDFDVAFWLDVARGGAGPVLDLGCGTGRVLVRLAEAGIDVDGLDAAPAMIARLDEKLAARGLAARAQVGDMRDFTMPRRYARVLCAFNAFAHCATTEDQLATLRCVREHLLPEGALVLHQSYPGPAYWAGEDGVPVFEHETPPEADGHRLQMWDTRQKNVVEQFQRSETEVRELDASGACVRSVRFVTAQRWAYRFELELLFRAAGFARSEIQGDFAGEPLTRPDQQMVAWAWKD